MADLALEVWRTQNAYTLILDDGGGGYRVGGPGLVPGRSAWVARWALSSRDVAEIAAALNAGGGGRPMADKLRLVPVTFAEASEFVAAWHRHHKPPRGHKFSVGVASGDTLVGVAMVGRPVARHLDDGHTLEVNRTCTDGHHNVNSMLYGAAWRAAKAMGYRRLITYTQEGESGASLAAAGWSVVAELPPRAGWSAPSRPRGDHAPVNVQRKLWEAVA